MEQFKTILAQAVIRILKPLIRVLIRNDVSHGEFAEYIKQAYIDVAYKHFVIPGRKMTYSRVSILTGLNRKEVVRLSASEAGHVRARKGTTNRAMRVVSGWLHDEDFQSDDGQPRVLSIKGEGANFDTLVMRYSGDITARAVLDELERVGVARFSFGDQSVELLQQAYIPRQGEPEQMDVLSICVSDLLETAVHNLDSDEPHFQRQLIHKEIPEDLAREFKTYSQKKSIALLNDLNRWITKKADGSSSETQRLSRVGVGIYYFEDAVPEDAVPQKEKEK
ncbi:MAG: DUF6502 family protein [Gammaproteobacteria bacterium]